MNLTKHERIILKKQQELLKDRHSRKLEKFSDNFNEIFIFFLKSYRKGLLNFAGSKVEVFFNYNSVSSKEGFRLYDDGYFKLKDIYSKHNNILQAVIIAKKSWGLNSSMWSDGISECNFTLQEILDTFNDYKIIIPDTLLTELKNEINKKKLALIK